MSNFDAGTLASFPKLLYLLAYAEKRSLGDLAQHLNLNIKTTKSMLNYLKQADLINFINPQGSQMGHLTKPYRYSFSSPALRQALINVNSLSGQKNQHKLRIEGLLLEDLIYMYLKHIFQFKDGIIEYDYNDGAADFIISSINQSKSIAIEVGRTKKSSYQIKQTLDRFNSHYGIVISKYTQLKHNPDTKTVYIPLKYFLCTL